MRWKRHTRGRRRVRLWLGAALLTAGAAVLGYVGWQLIGTTLSASGVQTELVEQLQDRWETSPGSQLGKGQAQPTSGDTAALIRIPRFGDEYVDAGPRGCRGRGGSPSGFEHFDRAAGPGQLGNYALAAHRVTHGEPLRDMPSLRPGDTVLVETRDAIYTYELDTDPNDLVVGFDATGCWRQRRPARTRGVQPEGAHELITLVTCAELFHTEDRMVTFGHLVAREDK